MKGTDSSPQLIDDVLCRNNSYENHYSSKEERSLDMADSCMTAPTETGSISEDEGFGWFGGITSDIRTLAFTLKETAGGVASFVQRSALAVASEIAHLEEEEMAHQMERAYEHQYDENVLLRLPWEVLVVGSQGEYDEDETLKKKIFSLSTKEDTFLRPFSVKDVEGSGVTRPPFVLDEPRIRLVRRILNLDDKLAAMHARLSGRSDVKEAVFWQNYFYNCELTREEHLVLIPDAVEALELQRQPLAQMESFEEATTEGGETEDSYVEVPSPPASQRSVGSMVLIDLFKHLEMP